MALGFEHLYIDIRDTQKGVFPKLRADYGRREKDMDIDTTAQCIRTTIAFTYSSNQNMTPRIS